MIHLTVTGMSCGHCVNTVTEAIKVVDGDARVAVDLKRGLVDIDNTTIGAAAIISAITEAGYTAAIRSE